MEVLLDVSGFKLEDTDKRKIDEYLKTLNTREVLPASSTTSNGNELFSNAMTCIVML
mgnify:CR=1 FL=1